MPLSKGHEFVIGGHTRDGNTFDALIFGYNDETLRRRPATGLPQAHAPLFTKGCNRSLRIPTSSSASPKNGLAAEERELQQKR
jgi:hypothetical protein